MLYGTRRLLYREVKCTTDKEGLIKCKDMKNKHKFVSEVFDDLNFKN